MNLHLSALFLASVYAVARHQPQPQPGLAPVGQVVTVKVPAAGRSSSLGARPTTGVQAASKSAAFGNIKANAAKAEGHPPVLAPVKAQPPVPAPIQAQPPVLAPVGADAHPPVLVREEPLPPVLLRKEPSAPVLLRKEPSAPAPPYSAPAAPVQVHNEPAAPVLVAVPPPPGPMPPRFERTKHNAPVVPLGAKPPPAPKPAPTPMQPPSDDELLKQRASLKPAGDRQLKPLEKKLSVGEQLLEDLKNPRVLRKVDEAEKNKYAAEVSGHPAAPVPKVLPDGKVVINDPQANIVEPTLVPGASKIDAAKVPLAGGRLKAIRHRHTHHHYHYIVQQQQQ